MSLIRGSISIGRQFLRPKSYDGILAPFFAHGRGRYFELNDDSKVQKTILSDLRSRIMSSPEVIRDPELGRTYDSAIDDLCAGLTTFSRPDYRPVDITDAFVWRFLHSEAFVPLLRAQKQEAVAILAHFCILLGKMESQWWLQGWGTHLLSRAWEILDQDHRLWIQWPIEELGWVPPPR
jgi:hypothetical protein